MSFDQNKSDAFGDSLVALLNQAALSLMISVGHRTGLFDVMTEMQPSTSEEIAERAKLNERYVREWLGAMTTGRITEYDPMTRRYRLPPEHAVFLARKFSPNNVALFAQYIPELGSVEDDIVECFEKGGGVPYERFTRFHEIMTEDSGQSVLSSLFEHILPLIPDIQERLDQGIHVLDVGCGSALALNMMAERFRNSRFFGFDLSVEAITNGRKEAERRGLSNLELRVKDLSYFDSEAEEGKYDLITTFDAVHDQAKPLAVLRGIYRSLKQDGVYLMQDIGASSEVQNNMEHPLGPLLYTVSCMHCMTVSLAQDGDGLGAMWGREKATQLLKTAGFTTIEIRLLPHDIQNEYYIIRK